MMVLHSEGFQESRTCPASLARNPSTSCSEAEAAAPNWAFRLFVLAALAGFVLFGIDVATKKLPVWLGFLHGAVGLAGFVFR
jgi:hypothetical protein